MWLTNNFLIVFVFCPESILSRFYVTSLLGHNNVERETDGFKHKRLKEPNRDEKKDYWLSCVSVMSKTNCEIYYKIILFILFTKDGTIAYIALIQQKKIIWFWCWTMQASLKDRMIFKFFFSFNVVFDWEML